MREIEFRGKRVDNGEWVYGLPVYMNYIKEFTKHEWIDNLDNNKVKEYQTTADFQIEGETLGQYTGLEDKNGTKIFEGDIVKYGKVKAVVKFSSKYNLGANGHEYDYEICGFYAENEFMTDSMIEGKVEVIGNIYDNPELLNK